MPSANLSNLVVPRIVVTVDGLAGTGKSSIAAGVASELGFVNFSTGLIYRAVGFLALQEGVSLEDEQALAEMLKRHTLELVDASNDLGGKKIGGSITLGIKLDGKIQGKNLRTPAVSEATSLASRFPVVREQLLELQRTAYPDLNLVTEGRDMGSVVFTDAPVKFFIEVPVETRVGRRMRQLSNQQPGLSAGQLTAEITREIIERDKRDTERSASPTVAAADAIVIDNSKASLDETIKKIAQIVRERCGL